MAELTATSPSNIVKVGGNLAIKTISATTGTAESADEWVRTGLKRVDAVLGVVVKGTTAALGGHSAVSPIATIDTLTAAVGSTASIVNNEISTIGELVSKTEPEMLAFHNFGKKSLDEIKAILDSMGLSLGMDVTTTVGAE